MAVDNGLLSFVDVDHGKWPVVLVTNPKNAEFLSPQVEHIENILQSKSIRILAFSPVGIKSVSVKINNEDWKTCQLTSGNLYTAEWSPEDYESEVNSLRVEVVDGFGDSKEFTQSFVVRYEDAKELKYSLYARIILMGSPHTLFKESLQKKIETWYMGAHNINLRGVKRQMRNQYSNLTAVSCPALGAYESAVKFEY